VPLEHSLGETFTFIGTAVFDGHSGELREAVSGGNLLVSLDSAGDRKADFTIVFAKLTSISASSFTL
jgi:hypothetical protein